MTIANNARSRETARCMAANVSRVADDVKRNVGELGYGRMSEGVARLAITRLVDAVMMLANAVNDLADVSEEQERLLETSSNQHGDPR